jgi:single-strand DNA-binding protein
MSQGLNKAQLIGNVGQNPDLKYTQNGTAVMTLRVATNERFKNKDNEWTDRAEWHSVVVWGKRAEGLSKVVEKGTSLYVEGRLQTRSWDDKEGQKRYSTEIVANLILLLGRKGGSSDAGTHDDEGYSSSKGGGGKGGGGDGYNGPDTGEFADDEIPF